MDSRDISTELLQKSYDFLKLALRGESTEEVEHFLAKLSVNDMSELMEDEKKVFWINLYNGFVQVKIADSKSIRVDKKIFSTKTICIAGEQLSLDTIEHGIIRSNYWKFGLGYLPGNYLNRKTQKWRCQQLDYRVHFQLNCGAASCPIIRPLKVETLHSALNLGQKHFIASDVLINDAKKKITVSALFLFYLHDFQGIKGIKRLIGEYYPNQTYRLKFSTFDWTKSAAKVK